MNLHSYQVFISRKLPWSSLSFYRICAGLSSRCLLGCACLGSLCAVLGTGLTSLGNALSIKCSSDDVVTHTGEILNSSASDENNRVLLKVMTDTGDISCHFVSVSELDSGDLSHCGVRLLRCSRSYRCAYSSFLRRAEVDRYLLLGIVALLKCGSRGFLFENTSALAYQLIKGWHSSISFQKIYVKILLNTFYYYTHYSAVCQGVYAQNFPSFCIKNRHTEVRLLFLLHCDQ